VITEWGNHFESQCSANTFKRYLCSLEQLGPFLEGRKLSEVDSRLVAEIVRERQKVVTPATIKRDLVALSSVINCAIDESWCESNPVLPRLGRLKERRGPINLPHDNDIELVISRAPGLWPYLIRAALLTGAREDELIKASRRDLDTKRKELTVVGKGDKRRVIDLKWGDTYKLFESIPAFVDKPWLFWRHEDKRVRSDSEREATFRGDQIEDPGPTFARLGNATEAWAEEEGRQFVRFRFHDLRHRHCVDFLKAGGNIFDLQQRGRTFVDQADRGISQTHLTRAGADREIWQGRVGR
jgi:integrase/recombinase XerD